MNWAIFLEVENQTFAILREHQYLVAMYIELVLFI